SQTSSPSDRGRARSITSRSANPSGPQVRRAYRHLTRQILSGQLIHLPCDLPHIRPDAYGPYSKQEQAGGGHSPHGRPSPNGPRNQLELNRRNRRTSRETAMNILNHALCVAALSLLISVPSRAENIEVETG